MSVPLHSAGFPITRELRRFFDQDAKLFDVARHIKVLSALAWPEHIYQDFIHAWHAGQPKLPQIEYPRLDLSEHRDVLVAISKACDPGHPIGRYLNQTANSYVAAARMLENIGTKTFRDISEALYGSSTEKLGKLTNLNMAEDFIQITGDLSASIEPESEQTASLSPESLAAILKARADAFFTGHNIQIIVDPALTAKAAAGAERVRIRGSSRFASSEAEQLLQHELFVHSATILNGRDQPYLKTLGLGAPRTTCTQEGLATFAEMVTATMDLSRLRRIALRIKGVHLACEGGDFIDVFKFFLEAGQSFQESFQSAARIFRGGDVRGRHVFTKDIVYLKGLFSVHTFMRKAIEARKIDYPSYLFVGRVTLGDVISLEPFIQNGLIAAPLYLPPWAANREGLAAYLSYAVFANRLRLAEVSLSDFVEDLPLEIVADTDVPQTA